MIINDLLLIFTYHINEIHKEALLTSTYNENKMKYGIPPEVCVNLETCSRV